MPAPSAAEPFDRRRRRARRDRAFARIAAHGFLVDGIAGELLERLDAVRRRFDRALLVGASPLLSDALGALGVAVTTADAGAAFARAAGGVQCDEDRLPFADGSFDLILSAGVLDSVNDLPGALILMRRILAPGGLLLAGMPGAGSLPRLRAAMLAADMVLGRAGLRMHPQVDVRAAGDLLGRAGFALPVADGHVLDVRYRTLDALLRDLRFSGFGGTLAGTPAPLTRMQARRAHTAFAEAGDLDGRTTERFEIVYLTGWAPEGGA